MELLLNTILLLAGFALLIKGSDYFVDGASALAEKMNVSQITIGLTVVAFGTSSPELLINVFASLQGKSGISFGNVIGSNILNLLLILGISAIVMPLRLKKNTVWREIPYLLLSAVVLFVLCNDVYFSGASANVLSRGDGIILLLFFAIFMVYVFLISKVNAEHYEEVKPLSNGRIAIYLVAGIGGLFFGGKLAVDNASALAQKIGASDRLIAVTVIAFGTSLPELFTSITAARKKKFDIAVGNAIGSSLFNVLFVLPVSAIIAPLPFDTKINFDLFVMALASALLFFAMFTGKRKKLDRWEGAVLVGIYLFYLFLIITKINLV
jgi:cation:H+ antiporter